MKDLMIDIEAFGNGQNALICQIGAVYFDRTTGELGDEYKVNIDAEDAETYGCQFDASTMYWWLAQSEEARNSITAMPRTPLLDAMMSLKGFTASAKTIWSHATYDFVIIQETLKKLKLDPLPYRKARDIRTLVDLAGVKYNHKARTGLHHDALDDCKFQVGYCVEAFRALKL